MDRVLNIFLQIMVNLRFHLLVSIYGSANKECVTCLIGINSCLFIVMGDIEIAQYFAASRCMGRAARCNYMQDSDAHNCQALANFIYHIYIIHHIYAGLLVGSY